ncbi:MAG: hypothetical protein ACOYL8_00665 [Patescibacteria group bacterium]
MKEIKFIPKYRVDAIPVLNKNAFETLDDFSKCKHKNIEELSREELLNREVLNDIYKELNENKKELLDILAYLESSGVISSNDKLFTSCLFLISSELGSGLENISEMIDKNIINLELANSEIESSGMPDKSKQAFNEILFRINLHFYDLRIREKI